MSEVFAESDRVTALHLEDGSLPPPTPEIDQERRVAVFELLEENRFALVEPGAQGPYEVTVGLADRRLALNVAGASGTGPVEVRAPLGALRPLIADYFAVCDSYYDAVRSLPPSRIEALDQARRDLHREGAAALKEKLAEQVCVDAETARRLFTVVCALVGPNGGGA